MFPYKQISKNGKVILEHRAIVEESGIVLSNNEVVHHKNGKTKDNRLNNLEVLSRSKHSSIHHKKAKIISINCSVCNKTFNIKEKFYLWRVKKRQKKFMCSKKCVGIESSKFLPHDNVKSKYIAEKVKIGLSNNLTGYQIAIKYNLNRKSVYNHIHTLEAH